jgi:Ca-activated chloride channel family protein
MGALFRKIDSPVLHDLTIEWGDANVEAWPARIPDVYLSEPVVIAARLPKGVKRITLHGRQGSKDVQLDVSLGGGSDHVGVSRLWARRKVAALMNTLHEGAAIDRVSSEVAALGVRHQLVTRWSSLIAVDVTPTAPPHVEAKTRAIPSLLPAGWDFRKVFGGSDPDPVEADRRRQAAPPQAGVRSATQATTNTIRIAQPLAMIQIGTLPQGGTPAALLMMLGSSLIGGTGAVLGLRRQIRGGKR